MRDWFGDTTLDFLLAFSPLPSDSSLNLFAAGVDFTAGELSDGEGDLELNGDERGLLDILESSSDDLLESLESSKDDFLDKTEFCDPRVGV